VPALDELPGLLWGSLVLRPYVFGFLILHVGATVVAWGGARAGVFTGLAAGLALAAELASTRVGVPFGLYHYTGLTRGQELYLANVPFFDPLSFSFLAYASLGLARLLLAHRVRPAGGSARLREAGLTGLLMMWLDVVIDPLAVRGERWFLGRIFYYPDPGFYFGVPLANFVGWALTGTTIAVVWAAVEPRLPGGRPAWAASVPGGAFHPVGLYYLILAFNLILTAAVAEAALFWAGVAAHLPLALLVICSVWSGDPARRAGDPA
jgi:uncharacterized membrane protein